MRTFIWTIVGMLIVNAILKLFVAGQGKRMVSEPPALVANAAIHFALIAWALVLLFTGP